jgi:cysteine desulfurase
MRRIYLDFNASTPVHPAVAQAMRAALEDGYGNPSSRHWAGAPAKELLETSRRQIADLLGCSSPEVVLTSGGSEANNLAIKGSFFAQENRAAHIVATQIEHPSVLSPLSFLLRAMNVAEHIGRGAVRFSLGRETTAAELTEVVERLAVILQRR